VRRALTRRFPYKIFFEERGEGIQVLAVRHHSQRPLAGLEQT
jgi:plasmid stabilization system protein ParE